MKKLAREISIDRNIDGLMVKKDLKLAPYYLTGEYIFFTNVKVFPIEPAHNSHNDRKWSLERPRPSDVVMHRYGMEWNLFVLKGLKVNQCMYRNILGPGTFCRPDLDVSAEKLS